MKKNLNFFQKALKNYEITQLQPWITLIFFSKMSGNPVSSTYSSLYVSHCEINNCSQHSVLTILKMIFPLFDAFLWILCFSFTLVCSSSSSEFIYSFPYKFTLLMFCSSSDFVNLSLSISFLFFDIGFFWFYSGIIEFLCTASGFH